MLFAIDGLGRRRRSNEERTPNSRRIQGVGSGRERRVLGIRLVSAWIPHQRSGRRPESRRVFAISAGVNNLTGMDAVSPDSKGKG